MSSQTSNPVGRCTGLIAAASVIPAVCLAAFGREMVMVPMVDHFAVVGIAAVVALGAAVGLTAAGAKRGDGRAVLVGTAFSAMTALLLFHALATPTVLVGSNGLVQLAGAMNIPVGAAVLALSAWAPLRRPASIAPLFRLQSLLLAIIAAVGLVGLLSPGTIPALPGPGGPLALTVMAGGLGLLALLAYRAARTFLLTRRRSDLAVAIGVCWLGGALAGLLLYGYTEAGFWIAHVFEVAGLALVGAPIAFDLHRGAQSYPLAGDLSAVRLVSQEEAFLGPRVRALMLRLSEKDAYTEAHTRGVALLAVRIGEKLGLAPDRLRTLAIGGLLHDIGKLSVPDDILQKPSVLTDDEFAVVRRHPTWGSELLAELGGFAPEVRRLVLDHHERLDGKGYPRGLDAAALNVETRIMTVCDVYDALVSKRVYRDAWTSARALALLREESGAAFDAEYVATLEQVITEDPEFAARPASSLRLTA